MLQKKKRLTTAVFSQVFKTGQVQHTKSFLIRISMLPSTQPSRFAVSVSKKVAPTAVLRNKIKRIVYRAIELSGVDTLVGQPGCAIVFGVKSDISKLVFEDIVKEIQGLQLKKGLK